MTDFTQRLKFEYTGSTQVGQMISDLAQLNAQLTRLAQLSGRTSTLRNLYQQTQQMSQSFTQVADDVQLLKQRLESIGRIAVGVFLARGLGALTKSFNESISEAFKLEQAIAEIDTISNQARFSTQGWSNELIKLSNAFNIGVLDVAESAYQTLSNQIAQGAEATEFLAAAGRLSIATVSDMSTSVDALSGIINAYGLQASDAEAISAKLFVTIREGRLRLDDIADSIGNVAVLASQLGISVDELLASIATLTIQGVKTSETLTAIRGVLLKTLRPTEAMRNAIEQLGFESASSAIQSLGVINFLDQLRGLSESGVDGLEEFANAFGRVRAAIGGVGLQKESARFRDIVGDMTNNIEEYNKAVERVRSTDSFQVTQEMNEFKNFIIQFVGGTFVTSISNFNRLLKLTTGGVLDLSRALALVSFGVFAGGVVLVVAQAVSLINTLSQLNFVIQTFAIVTGQASIATAGLGAALLSTGGFLALAAAIGAAAGALTFYITDVRNAQSETVAFANTSIDAYERVRAEFSKELKLGADKAFQAASNEVTKFVRNVNGAQAALQRVINQHEQIKSEIRDLEQDLFQQQLQERELLGDDQGALNLLLKRAQVVKAQMRDAIAEGSKDGFDAAKTELSSLANQISSLDDGLNVAFKDGRILSTSQVAAALISDLQGITREQLTVLREQEKVSKQELQSTQNKVDKLEEASDLAGKQLKAFEDARVKVDAFAESMARTSATVTAFVESNTQKILGQIEKLDRIDALGRGKATAAGDRATDQDRRIIGDLQQFLESIQQLSQSGDILRPEILGTLLQDADEVSRKLPLLTPLVKQFAQDEIKLFDQLRGQLNEGAISAEKWKTLVEDVANKARALAESGIGDLAEEVNKALNEQGGAVKIIQEGSAALEALINTSKAVLEQTLPAVEQTSSATQGSVEAAYSAIRATQAAANAAYQRAADALALAQQANFVSGGIAFANAGSYIRRYNTGGVGTDTVPAMLSPGEFVMNKRETAKFFPQLVGMNNTGRTQRFDSGGVTVGDVNVSLSGVDSPEIVAREIGNQLRREIRRGVLRLS